jgi:hypothetical protein
MINTKIILSATWIVVTLLYLYGDVFRICSGDLAKKPMAEMNLNQYIWLGLAILMMIPILMVFLNLVMPQPVSRWVNLIVAVFFFLFNLVGLPTYASLYDKFLIAISMGFNVVTIWYAWNWSLSAD